MNLKPGNKLEYDVYGVSSGYVTINLFVTEVYSDHIICLDDTGNRWHLGYDDFESGALRKV